MSKVILFGGTTEGRELAEFLTERHISSLICVATEYGERQLNCIEPIIVHTGRLDSAAILSLFRTECPILIIDATHPYAAEITKNIKTACAFADIRYLRLLRKSLNIEGCECFSDMDSLVKWLNKKDNIIFSTMGAKEARVLSSVSNYKNRVYLRILPDPTGLTNCIELGFPMKHLFCLQGPFSVEFNRIQFIETGAKILLTKESGKSGGFTEKLEAARQCGMSVAVLVRPKEMDGVLIEEVKATIREICL
ncbi:MAG: precorrin-6A reductase [Clostridia bacterium]